MLKNTEGADSEDQYKRGRTHSFIICVPNLSKEMFFTKIIKIIMVYDNKNYIILFGDEIYTKPET